MFDTPQKTSRLKRPKWQAEAVTAGPAFAGSLQFQSVSHTYSETPAVSNISFDVEPGQTVCLLGESGCGKTTLLRIAAGIERQSEGLVLIDGVAVSSNDTFIPPEHRSVGLVFQDYALFPHLSILRNVMFGLTRLKRAEAKQVALQALTRVGMAEYANVFPHTLSGGQQQRVALARAIAPRPQVLLLDEPFSGLDSLLRERVREETRQVLKETGAASIIVTHDPEEAMYLGDKIVLLRDGVIVQEGAPNVLYRNPVNGFVASFLGDFNIFEGQVSKGHVETTIGVFEAEGFSEGSKVDVYVRQEGMHIVPYDASSGLPSGRVISERFAGETLWLSVLIEGEQIPMRLKMPSSLQLQGNVFSLKVDYDDVFIFGSQNV